MSAAVKLDRFARRLAAPTCAGCGEKGPTELVRDHDGDHVALCARCSSVTAVLELAELLAREPLADGLCEGKVPLELVLEQLGEPAAASKCAQCGGPIASSHGRGLPVGESGDTVRVCSIGCRDEWWAEAGQ